MFKPHDEIRHKAKFRGEDREDSDWNFVHAQPQLREGVTLVIEFVKTQERRAAQYSCTLFLLPSQMISCRLTCRLPTRPLRLMMARSGSWPLFRGQMTLAEPPQENNESATKLARHPDALSMHACLSWSTMERLRQSVSARCNSTSCLTSFEQESI